MLKRISDWLTTWLEGVEALVVTGLAAELDVAPAGRRPRPAR